MQQIGIVPELPSKRKRKPKRFHDEVPTCADEDIKPTEEVNFKQNVFYNLIDSVIAGLTDRYKAAKAIESTFSFLWQYSTLSENEIKCKEKHENVGLQPCYKSMIILMCLSLKHLRQEQ